LSNTAGTALLANVLSTVVLPLAGGEYAKFSAVVTRETASADGSLVFYVNGAQLGDAITITSAATTSIDITNSLIICGSDSGVRYASDTTNAIIYNRALTAAEVLSLCVNGPALADLGASQTQLILNTDFEVNTANWTAVSSTVGRNTVSPISGTADLLCQVAAGTGVRGVYYSPVSVFKSNARYRLTFKYRVTADSLNVALDDIAGSFEQTIISGLSSTSNAVVSVEFTTGINIGANQRLLFARQNLGAVAMDFNIDDVEVYQIGITGQWNAENAQSETGQIFDSSGNKNHALLPAAGATIIGKESAQLRQVRWTNTWSGTNELQYIGGVNQAILPANAYIESIIGTVTGATPHDIIIGDGSDTDRYVTITTGLAAGTTSFTLANRTTDGTNLKLTVDPDTNATMSIAWVITYTTLE
jgi:hypothetical protein